MIILLVVLTFATAIFVDHLLLRRTLVVLSGESSTTPAPRGSPKIASLTWSMNASMSPSVRILARTTPS